jgi:acetate kinase
MLDGRSVGSTMGFSALDGLPMGTRCGQLDPGVLLYLMEQEGMGVSEISDLLYKRSGLLGLSGVSNDMRTLEAAGTPETEQAIDYFVFRVRRELGGLTAVLGGLDALVFTGGIGENSRKVRQRICEGLGWLGIELDRLRNEQNARVISTDLSRVRLFVLPTNEELVIARAAARLMNGEGIKTESSTRDVKVLLTA